ncbi:MAG: hypothetical protein ACJZ10_01750 [Candidatus Neomarinimicrobiota bacterium]
MKNILLLCSVLFFSFGCNTIQPTTLTVIVLDDCKDKIYNDIVDVSISRVGNGIMGKVSVKVGDEKGMTIMVEEGNYILESKGVGKGSLSGTRRWKENLTIGKNQQYTSRISCLK